MKLKKFLIKCIDFYQRYISIFIKPSCVFSPTCSDYAKQAIEKYGAIHGIYLGIRRILRCHPWQQNHIDPLN
ncbi:membrane protein insertion efficiency factor YidD [Candidatus Nomurabacteria bacterium]|nr:membrane protein insertion efficiency factor YidD [Candidatus Nomurabacteria bacterium]